MKHLYKTKEGEILEAFRIDFDAEEVCFTGRTGWHKLSEVQEVVLDKDGEPFIFEGEVVCVGDSVVVGNYCGTFAREIIDWNIFDSETLLFVGTSKNTCSSSPEHIKSHTPKHTQKKGIEKIDISMFDMNSIIGNAPELTARKLNELIEVVNKLKE